MRLFVPVSDLIFSCTDGSQLQKSEYEKPYEKYVKLAPSNISFDNSSFLYPRKIAKHKNVQCQPNHIDYDWVGPLFGIFVGESVFRGPFGVCGCQSDRLVFSKVLLGVKEVFNCLGQHCKLYKFVVEERFAVYARIVALKVAWGHGGRVCPFELQVELAASFFDELLVVSVLQTRIIRPVVPVTLAAKNLTEVHGRRRIPPNSNGVAVVERAAHTLHQVYYESI
jgi:hypothetical protein